MFNVLELCGLIASDSDEARDVSTSHAGSMQQPGQSQPLDLLYEKCKYNEFVSGVLH